MTLDVLREVWHAVLCVLFAIHCLHRIPTASRQGYRFMRHDGTPATRWEDQMACCRCPHRTYRHEVEDARDA